MIATLTFTLLAASGINQDLRGLDPAFYSQQRRPEPEVTRELKRLNEPTARLLERLAQGQRDTSLSKAELFALHQGIVVALSGHTDDTAKAFLRSELRNKDLTLAGLAATVYGQSFRAVAFADLKGFAVDPNVPVSLRIGALRGLGKSRLGAATDVLSQLGIQDKSADIRRAAIASLAQLAPKTVRLVRTPANDEARADDVAQALVAVLVAQPSHATDIAEALQVVGADNTLPLLRSQRTPANAATFDAVITRTTETQGVARLR